MAVSATIAGVSTGISAVNKISGLFTGAGSKKSARDQARNILMAGGVNYFGTHYNRSEELGQILQIYENEQNLVVQAMNEQIQKTQVRGDGNLHKADYESIFSRINYLRNQKQQEQKKTGDSGAGGVLAGAGSGGQVLMGLAVLGVVGFLVTQK